MNPHRRHPTPGSRHLCLLVLLAACTNSAPTSVPAPAFSKRADGQRGMVSASHPDAAAAGLEILRAGGNAVDAAVAVAFALGVVDPSQTGLGGGGGMVVWLRQDRRAETLDFYARTGADPAWAQPDSGGAGQPINARSAGIPGTVAGMLEAHARWGRLQRAQIMAPAIRLARDGFAVSPLLSRTSESARAKLAADTAAARLFLPGGQPIRVGERLVQPELAATLQVIADQGTVGFYRGPLADRAIAKLRALGSRLTVADWNGYRPEGKRALCSPWLGHTVLTVAPPLGGVTVVEALNLLAAVDARRLGSATTSADAALTMIGALRVAAADRSRWRGDPAFYGVPARGMASPGFAAGRAGLVATAPGTRLPFGDPWAADSSSAGPACDALDAWPASALGREAAPPPSGGGPPDGEAGEAASFTSHFSVIDAEHNAVAVTFTVGVLFGSGVYVNGYFLNSGGGNFDAQTRGPSRFGSSTIAPTIVLEGDQPRLVIGAAGSAYIPTSVTQVAFRMLALGEDPWLAIAAPRLQPSGVAQVEVEPGFAPAVYQALRERGFLTVNRVADITFGGVHAVLMTRGGRMVGVADPRRDGAAMGW